MTVVKVDFSDELLDHMNIGTAMESEVLKSIVNTFGKFYDAEKVYISVNGRPYESGHFALRNEDGFLVDTEEIEKFNN
jgi:spore germination protein GerM